MKQLLFLLLIEITLNTNSYSQISGNKITGEYYLEGVREMGSGLKLNEDGSFQFFFSYGALDKYGTGTYEIQGDQLVLNSRPRPQSDFALFKSKSSSKNGIKIKVTDNNPIFMDEVNCRVVSNGISETVETNEDGEAAFKIKQADTVFMYHPIFSNMISQFVPDKASDNYFEFKIDPCIMEIFCNNLILEIKDGKLVGHHPLLDPNKDYEFVKGN